MKSVKGLFLVNVGSHIETIESITHALVSNSENTFSEFLLLDLVGWQSWDATRKPYGGKGMRRQLSPSDWGLFSSVIKNKDKNKIIIEAEKLLLDEKINILVTFTDTEIPNWAFIQAANHLRIPSLLVQEGPRPQKLHNSINNKKLNPFTSGINIVVRKCHTLFTSVRNGTLKQKLAEKLFPDYRLFSFPIYGGGGAQVMAVLSDYYAKYYRKTLGNSCPLLQVTGAPRFDNLLMSRQKYTEKQGKLKNATEKFRVLVISQPAWRYGELTLEMQLENYRSIFKGLNELSQEFSLDVVLRLHPSDQIEDVIQFFDGLPLQVTLQSFAQPVYKVLPDYDLIIGCTSTVLIEALITGVPVVSWQRHIPSPGSFIENLNVPIVYDIDQLIQCVKEIHAGKANSISDSVLENEIGNLCGGASERVAKLCIDLCKKSHNL